MTDDEVRTIEQLLDKKLSPLHEELKGVNRRLDTVAAHLGQVDERVSSIAETQSDDSKTLDRMERRLSGDLDRLDDHGGRIEAGNRAIPYATKNEIVLLHVGRDELAYALS